jgi:hypothetical protein
MGWEIKASMPARSSSLSAPSPRLASDSGQTGAANHQGKRQRQSRHVARNMDWAKGSARNMHSRIRKTRQNVRLFKIVHCQRVLGDLRCSAMREVKILA